MKFRTGAKLPQCLLLAASSGFASAQTADLYPTAPSTVQDRLVLSARPGEYYYNLSADAVRHKDYAHAVEMYQVASSWAYKTAQYNLGVMYARGEGVAVDLPRAMAWMTLAAERGDKQYVQARDVIASNLDKDGLATAEKIVQELIPTHGDAAAMPRAKLRWREVRDGATGSHLGASNGPVSVGNESQRYIPTPGKNGKTSPTPMGSVADITGTTGVDSTIAYRDLRMTDNPYDPRLQQGVATVGPVTTVGDKKAVPSNTTESASPASAQQKQQR